MIVISAGMQRAASASYFNLTNDLLMAAGYPDVRDLRARYGFGFFATEANCNVGPLRAYKMAWLSLPHWLGQSFVVKTHEPPSPSARLLLKAGIAKATYIYRDPRDVALSLYEHGTRLRANRTPTSTQFDQLRTIEQAIQFTAGLLPIWRAWTAVPGVRSIRFEQFTSDMAAEARALRSFLDLEVEESALDRIVARYDPGRFDQDRPPVRSHFQTGRSRRWEQRLTEEQKTLCDQLYAGTLSEMGYQ